VSFEAANAQMAAWDGDRTALVARQTTNDMYGAQLHAMKEKLKSDAENIKLKYANEKLKEHMKMNKRDNRGGWTDKRRGKGGGKGGGKKGQGGKGGGKSGGKGRKSGGKNGNEDEDEHSEDDEINSSHIPMMMTDEEYVPPDFELSPDHVGYPSEPAIYVENQTFDWTYDHDYEAKFANSRGVSVGKYMWIFDSDKNTVSQCHIFKCVHSADRTLGEDKYDSIWEVVFYNDDGSEEGSYNYNYWALFSSKRSCEKYWDVKKN
jgi:hypothetical protein